MTLRSVLLLTSAIIISGGTAFGVKVWLNAERLALANQQTTETVLVEQVTVDVLTAKHDLSPGSFLTTQSVKWSGWPEDAVHDNHITRGQMTESQLDGAVARVALTAGEPLTNARIVHPGDRGFLAAVLEPGLRAVSMPVDATTGIAGFVFPGDRVDVLMTMRVRSEDQDGDAETRFFSQTVLRAIRILAIDQSVEAADGETSLAKTVTVEVTDKEAEKVAIALQMGDLSLSLNSLSKPASYTEITVADGDPTDTSARDHGRSYTLDTDIYNMWGDPRLFPTRGKDGAAGTEITILRGAESLTKVFGQ